MEISFYTDLLSRFCFSDTRSASPEMVFGYSDGCDPNLAQLRAEYKLDSAISEKDAIPKVLQAMNWVFRQFQSPGEIVQVPANNSLEILKRKDQGSFYCSHKSAVLSEVLLSLGIWARVVACAPFQFDYDRHVVVIAYVEDDGKWILVDPTFSTVFVDRNSEIMGPLEIRDAYSRGESPSSWTSR